MENGLRNALVVVDPQNDFCDQRGHLYVDGAYADIERLAEHIKKDGRNYTDIFVSLDSHDVIAIFHPAFWIDEAGCHPAPFTQIACEDFVSGAWRPASLDNLANAGRTFAVMRDRGIDSMMIWPEHCVVSTWGHQISDTLRDALRVWRENTAHAVRYIFKGENPYTDQFSIFEGLDDSWPETAFNEPLFQALSSYDTVTFAGQALSHCVGESVLSYLRRLGSSPQKVGLLADCTSPVAGFDRKVSLDRLASAGVSFSTVCP